MRHLYLIVLLIFISGTVSCKKINQSVTVIRDCTGTYLRLDGKDYHVCNLEKVSTFANETVITATFKKIKKCNGSANDFAVCTMLHDSEGWIEVEKAN